MYQSPFFPTSTVELPALRVSYDKSVTELQGSLPPIKMSVNITYDCYDAHTVSSIDNAEKLLMDMASVGSSSAVDDLWNMSPKTDVAKLPSTLIDDACRFIEYRTRRGKGNVILLHPNIFAKLNDINRVQSNNIGKWIGKWELVGEYL